MISIIRNFIARGVLDTETTYIEFVGDYEGVTRKMKFDHEIRSG